MSPGPRETKRAIRRAELDQRGKDRAQRASLPPAPMTEPQEVYLRALCDRHGRAFDPGWTKREASKMIDELNQG